MDSIPFQKDLLSELLIQKAIIEKTGIENAAIRRNEYGKPYLQGVKDFHFNLSHSGDYVVIAVSERHVGIDIEKKVKVDYRIAKKFFGEKEVQEILTSSEEQDRVDAFCRIWTLKESYVKAIGKGLSIPFSCRSSRGGTSCYVVLQGRLLHRHVFETCHTKVRPVSVRLQE